MGKVKQEQNREMHRIQRGRQPNRESKWKVTEDKEPCAQESIQMIVAQREKERERRIWRCKHKQRYILCEEDTANKGREIIAYTAHETERKRSESEAEPYT